MQHLDILEADNRHASKRLRELLIGIAELDLAHMATEIHHAKNVFIVEHGNTDNRARGSIVAWLSFEWFTFRRVRDIDDTLFLCGQTGNPLTQFKCSGAAFHVFITRRVIGCDFKFLCFFVVKIDRTPLHIRLLAHYHQRMLQHLDGIVHRGQGLAGLIEYFKVADFFHDRVPHVCKALRQAA